MGSSPTTNLFEGAVLIVRNPYDTLVAYANLVSAGHTGLASHQYFFSSDWDAFVESASIAWEERIVTWVTRTNVMVVYFERLQSHLRQEIVRILQSYTFPSTITD
nr:WSC domain-containing protein 1-like [Lytechinus pictus]